MFKPIINLLKYTWRYSKGSQRRLILIWSMSFLANILQLFEPYFVSKAFDVVQFTPNDPEILRQVTRNLVFIVFITLSFWLLHGTSRVMEIKNGFMVRKNYRKEMFDKVLALPTEWHKDHHSGDTIDKINKASESIHAFSSIVFIVITNIVRLVGGVIALWFFHKEASIIAFIIAVVVFSMIVRFDRVLRTGYLKIFKAENFLASAIHDYISNVITIITLRLKARVSNEIERRSMVAFPQFSWNAKIGETKWFSASLLLSIMITSVLILYAHQSYNASGIIAAGTLFALFQYLRRIGDTFFDFAMRYSDFVKYDASLQAAEVISTEYDKLVTKDSSFLPLGWREIKINNLEFSYGKEEGGRNHIEDVNLTITRGQRIAFIGESGSGKSTTLSLLRGLYPSNAELVVDGEIMKFGLEHLHEHITLIPQDPEIFNSTVEDNITMETEVSEEDLKEAIALAQFESVIERLPQGLATNVLEKGVSLSGGEKQRLALARGILAARDSDFLFMDEPTSSVDTTNELKIYESISNKFSDKTIISSIHRLHLLRLFDYVIYFKNGKILVEGTLEQLMKHPEFKSIWDAYSRNLNHD
jgi:ATP-binding cassette subfamily B protein